VNNQNTCIYCNRRMNQCLCLNKRRFEVRRNRHSTTIKLGQRNGVSRHELERMMKSV